jgi:hypothetical protein
MEMLPPCKKFHWKFLHGGSGKKKNFFSGLGIESVVRQLAGMIQGRELSAQKNPFVYNKNEEISKIG